MIETDGTLEGVRLWELGTTDCHWPLGGPLEQVEFIEGDKPVSRRKYKLRAGRG